MKQFCRRLHFRWCSFLRTHFNVTWVDEFSRKKIVKYHLYRFLDAFLCLMSLGHMEGNYAFEYILSDRDDK